MQYSKLRSSSSQGSVEKLQLNDASLTFVPESSAALGFGFRCGFLGLLHMEIVQERLDREFDMDVITTVPNVSFKCFKTDGEMLEVHNPSGLPEVTKIDRIDTREQHRFHVLETRHRLGARAFDVCDGIAHLDLLRSLDA